MVHLKTTKLVSVFRFRLTETGRHLHPPDMSTRAQNTRKMRLRPGLGCNRIFGVFRAHGTCLLAENVIFPRRGS